MRDLAPGSQGGGAWVGDDLIGVAHRPACPHSAAQGDVWIQLHAYRDFLDGQIGER